MTIRILMFGQSGKVAREISRRSGPGIDLVSLSRAEAELSDPGCCARIVAETDAEIVINAAAYTDVERAESEPELAELVNARAPGAIAEAAAARGIPFLHISTDYVFGAPGERPWREDDATDPRCVYARTKRAGEIAVAAAGGPHVILRTAWVFAGHGQSFVAAMTRAGARNRTLRVVEDQIGGPTSAGDIAEALLEIARAFAEGRGVSGIFHFCGAPAVSWCDFARQIFPLASWIPQPAVEGITSEEWPTTAVRPTFSVLDCRKILDVYGIPQPDWRDALGPALAELKEGAA